MTQIETSQGIDPVLAQYDICRDVFIFMDGADRYEWSSADLPFTVYRDSARQFADRALLRKHARTAKHSTQTAQEPFIPAWAEKTLGAQLNNELELEMLRAFFDAWERLHAIPNKPENRRKSETAAEALVEAAHAVRALRSPATVERIANGR
jgi:hypothetical protein